MKRLVARLTWWIRLPRKGIPRPTPQKGPAMDHSGNDVPKRESEISVLAEVRAVHGERIGNMNDLRRRSPLPWAPST
jgi:hypothetical protein